MYAIRSYYDPGAYQQEGYRFVKSEIVGGDDGTVITSYSIHYTKLYEGNITIAPDATPEDLTLTYNLSFPATTNGDYTGTLVNLQTNGDITQVAGALTMQPSELDEIFRNAGESAQEGTIAFAAVESDGSLNYSTTANGYGFWYSGQGDVTNWGNDSKIFVEFSLSNMEFTVGQFPDGSQAGDTYTVKEAFVYTKDGIQYIV